MRIGAWSVDPATHQIARDGQTVKLEARAMRLLQCLAERPGETVTLDELMERVWPGVVVTQDSVYQAVASLRRLLGDDSRTPSYIVTVPRRGYRLVAAVSPQSDDLSVTTSGQKPGGRPEIQGLSHPSPRSNDVSLQPSRWRLGLLLGAILLVAAVAVLFFLHRDIATRNTPPYARSVAVLPFLDLTSQAMTEEYFADGMTEELINTISKIPGVRVPSATASFYYKDHQLPVAAIAKALNVAYILDGSVRRSGSTLRVATRLVRAEDGFVLWSEAYDRGSADLILVQEDIARRVAQALESAPALQAR